MSSDGKSAIKAMAQEHCHRGDDAGRLSRAILEALNHNVIVPRDYLIGLERERRIPADFWPNIMEWLK